MAFEQIEDIATSMRDIFERILTDSIGTADTAGACLYASILLSTTLDKFAGTKTRICGGGPPMDGGVTDPGGVVRGHYWVEGQTKEGQPFLVDITADQFGYEKVVILALDAARSRYTPGDPERIAEHVREEMRVIEEGAIAATDRGLGRAAILPA